MKQYSELTSSIAELTKIQTLSLPKPNADAPLHCADEIFRKVLQMYHARCSIERCHQLLQYIPGANLSVD